MEQLASVLLINRAVIRDENRILLVQRSPEDTRNPSLWEAPGGKLDVNETNEEGVVREVYEETGLPITLLSPIVYAENEFITSGKYGGHLYVRLFHLAERLVNDVQLSDEHRAFSWDTPDQALARHDITPDTARALQAFRKAQLLS